VLSRWVGEEAQQGVLCWGSEDLKLLLGSVDKGSQSQETGLYVINSQRMSCVSLMPPTCQWGNFGLGWLDRHCHFLLAVEAASQQDPTVCHESFC
jgi:hypothetical protein